MNNCDRKVYILLQNVPRTRVKNSWIIEIFFSFHSFVDMISILENKWISQQPCCQKELNLCPNVAKKDLNLWLNVTKRNWFKTLDLTLIKAANVYNHIVLNNVIIFYNVCYSFLELCVEVNWNKFYNANSGSATRWKRRCRVKTILISFKVIKVRYNRIQASDESIKMCPNWKNLNMTLTDTSMVENTLINEEIQ